MPNKRKLVSKSHYTNRSTVRLRVRRREERIKRIVVTGILLVFLIIVSIIGTWQQQVRIRKVIVTTGDVQLKALVFDAISGTYAHVIPRDSILFFSSEDIRRAILSARPNIATVSISRIGYNSISVMPELRTPLARWCGNVATSTPTDILSDEVTKTADGRCYLFDGTGFLYQQETATSLASSTRLEQINTDAPLVPYAIYGSFLDASSSPIGATIAHSSELPRVFDLARQMHSLGVTVSAIVLRGDEVDMFLKNNTRVTYVIGDESEAFRLLSATRNKISLKDGSLLYVDLRFRGRVYFKKRSNENSDLYQNKKSILRHNQ